MEKSCVMTAGEMRLGFFSRRNSLGRAVPVLLSVLRMGPKQSKSSGSARVCRRGRLKRAEGNENWQRNLFLREL